MAHKRPLSTLLLCALLSSTIITPPAFAKAGGGGGGSRMSGGSSRGSSSSSSSSSSGGSRKSSGSGWGSSSSSGGSRRTYDYSSPRSSSNSNYYQNEVRRSTFVPRKTAARPQLENRFLKTRSDRPTYEKPVGERVRESTMARMRGSSYLRTSQTSSYSSYSSNEGFLNPSFSNMVISPFYYWVPFNVWHRNPSYGYVGSAGSSTSSGNAALQTTNSHVDGSLKDLRPVERYTGGEAGSAAVNDLPEWLQASLRLMHTKQSTPRSSDPVIKIDERSAAEISQENKAMRERLASLKAEQMDANALPLRWEEAKKLPARIEESIKDLSTYKPKIEAAEETSKARTKEFLAASDAVKTAQKSNWACNYLKWGCEKASAKETRQLELAEDASRNARWRITKLEQEKTLTERFIAEYQERLHRLQVELAEKGVNSDADAERLSQKAKGLQPEIDKLEKALVESARFVRLGADRVNFRTPAAQACRTGTIAAYFMDSQAGAIRHPLFNEDVEPELLPDSDASLVVCLDGQSKLASIHVVQDKIEIFGAAIHRDQAGAIEQIEIFQEGSKVVERHSWTTLANGDTRYALDFRDDDDQELSIFADFSNGK